MVGNKKVRFITMRLICDKELHYFLASKRDIDIILDVFRRAFHRSLKWKMKLYSKFWLSNVLDSSSCKFWLVKVDSRVVGILMLVNNYEEFLKIGKKNRLRLCWLLNLVYLPLFVYGIIRSIQKICRQKRRVTLQLNLNNGPGEKALSIEQLAVIPEFQGQGYGDKIVKLAKYLALRDGYNMLRLSVDKDNIPAYHLYIKNLFRET